MAKSDEPQLDDSSTQINNGTLSELETPSPEWKASRNVIVTITCLSIICVMASLDMTIFLPVLPVSTQ